MLATKQNWKDVQKYFVGTFVKFKELGDIPVYIERVDEGAIWARTKEQEKIQVILCNEGYNLDYIIPQKTVYQNGLHAWILQRIPARQWRKGLNEENTGFFCVLADGTLQKQGVRFNEVHQFVNKPSYRTLNDLTGGIGLASVALNHRFYATCNGLIYCDEHVVGKYSRDEENRLTIHYHRIFDPEMQSLFQDKGYNLIGV